MKYSIVAQFQYTTGAEKLQCFLLKIVAGNEVGNEDIVTPTPTPPP